MLTGIIVFLLLLVAVLAIPVVLSFQISRQQDFRGNIRLQWLFGIVQVNIPLLQPKATEAAKAEVSKPKKKTPKPSSGKGTKPIAVIRNRKFRRRMFQFFRDFWRAVHKEEIRLHIRVGLGDPADTGQLWAILGPLAGVLTNIQEARIDIQPEFIDSCFELESSGNIRLVPLQMLFLVLGLMMSPIFWQGMKHMRAVG